MNKEALRKELEDLVKVTQTWHYASIKDRERIVHPSQWISSRLAALDDGDDKADIDFTYQGMLTEEKSLAKDKPLDDGQGGRGLDGDLRSLGYDPEKLGERGIALVKLLKENTELKAALQQEQQNHHYTRLAWDRTCEKMDKLKAALPVADGEGERVGPASEKLGTQNDLIKSLNWCKNLLSSITAASIAGRNLDFVKHGTPFFEEMLMAYQSAKSVLAKPLPPAVTGGVKWVKAGDWPPEPGTYFVKEVDGTKSIATFEYSSGMKKYCWMSEAGFKVFEWLDEGQPE